MNIIKILRHHRLLLLLLPHHQYNQLLLCADTTTYTLYYPGEASSKASSSSNEVGCVLWPLLSCSRLSVVPHLVLLIVPLVAAWTSGYTYNQIHPWFNTGSIVCVTLALTLSPEGNSSADCSGSIKDFISSRGAWCLRWTFFRIIIFFGPP